MVYKLIFKKRFRNKLQNLLGYIENEFGLLVAQRFAKQLDKKFNTPQQQPFFGNHRSIFEIYEASTPVNITSFTIELKAIKLLLSTCTIPGLTQKEIG